MNRPLLRLSDAARVESASVTRDGVAVPVSDVVLIATLGAGLDPDRVAALLASPQAPVVRRMHRAGMLAWTLPGVAGAEVLTRGIDLRVPVPRPGAVPLSRFAVLRLDGGRWLLESGLTPWRVSLTARGVTAIADGDPDGWLAGLLDIVGMLHGEDARAVDWSVHDQLFMARTRGRLPFLGPPARQRGVAPEPALRTSGPGIPLPRPDGPEPDEPTLWQATESRRTVRDLGGRPVSLEALGHLLWRTLRVVTVTPADPNVPTSYDTVLRPVPSGGAMHATDLWLFCADVDGLAADAYRYDPAAHALLPVPGARVPDVGSAPVFGVITARHRRTAWKYEPIALSLELKDVGVQMMALQLSAAVVGLGMCPIGGGPTAEYAAALGIDPFVDAPVGEFVLGTLPSDSPEAGGSV